MQFANFCCVLRVLFMDDDKPVKWCHCLLELERETGIHGKQSNILFVVSKVLMIKIAIKSHENRMTVILSLVHCTTLDLKWENAELQSDWIIRKQNETH